MRGSIDFYKGIYRFRASRPKYDSTWDFSLVRNFIENLYPNETLSLEPISETLATLLAIASTHGVQTFSKINIDNITSSDSEIKIKITEIIKTSRVRSPQPILFLPLLSQKRAICLDRTLQYYMNVTSLQRPVYWSEKTTRQLIQPDA